MKKTYSTPEAETIKLQSSLLLADTSNLGGGGKDSGEGVGDSKAYQGGFLWDDDTEE